MRGAADRTPDTGGSAVASCVRFDRFVLDADAESLSRDDVPVSLSGATFAILRVLVAAAGRTVANEELAAKAGARELDACLAELRAALDDDLAAPRFVEAADGGYRFAAEVVALATSDVRPLSPEERARLALRGARCIWTNGAPASHDVALLDGARELGRGEVGGWTLDDSAVSRRHVRITCVHDEWRVEDCGSKNGSFVDGVSVGGGGREARPGSVVRIGETVLVLMDDLGRDHGSSFVVRAIARGARGGCELRASFIERALLDRRTRTSEEWEKLAAVASKAEGPVTASKYPVVVG